MDQQNLDELFAPPIGLKEVENLYGFKLYGSDRLNKSFLNAVRKSGRGNPIFPQIKALVEKKKIMPVFQVNGIKKFFAHKMFGNPEDKAILGFYHMGAKKVYIMIDNNISSLAHAKNDEIVSTTIHECQHLFADMNRTKFMSIYKDETNRYYTSAFSRIFDLNTIPRKEIDNIIKFISTFEGEAMNRISAKLGAYKKVLNPLHKYSNLSKEEFDRRVGQMLLVIGIFTKHFNVFLKIYREYLQIFGPLERAYRDAFGKRNIYTTPYQELISVSEVICVFSEIRPGNSNIKKGFKAFS